MNQGTIPSSQLGRWIVIAALVVLLGALLLTIRPAGAQDADAPPTLHNPDTVFEHPENSDASITTYTATDPDRLKKIFWTLRGADARFFTIEGGTLRFKSAPDYERPRGMATPTHADRAAMNRYEIILRLSAGGEEGTHNLSDAYDGDDVFELPLTVNVTNVDEPGMVALSSLQPQVGTRLRATLTDEDVLLNEGEWRWASADSPNGPFTTYLTEWVDKNTDTSADRYRPDIEDLGKYIQVAVRYKDWAGADEVRTAETVSTFRVRKDIVTSNTNPMFPDQRVLVGGTTINRGDTWRYIPENSPAGTPVGAPVTAFDDVRTIDVVTYSLSDDAAPPSTDPGTSTDSTKFAIDPATGQITVAAGTALDRRDDVPTNEGITTYYVTVTGTDGDGDSEDIDVTITVVKVDEPPTISRVDSTTGMMVAPTEMSHYEARRGFSPAVTIDTDLDTETLVAGTDEAVYRANDPEDGADNLEWTLEGDDGWLFAITSGDATTDTPPMATATLSFKTEAELKKSHPKSPVLDDYPNFPDFENARDKNGDNVYEITIVVTDSSLVNRDEINVTVKVINSTEDNRAGNVYLSNRQPEGNSRGLTATLDDKDLPIRGLKWQWYRSTTGSADVPITTCGAPDATSGMFVPDTALGTTTDGVFAPSLADTTAWTLISGATSATYIPEYDEDTDGPRDDAGKCLMAKATYTDWEAADPTMEDDATTADVDESKEPETAYGVSHHPVQIEDKDNTPPVFRVDPDLPNSAAADSYSIRLPENKPAINIGILRDDAGDSGTPGEGVLDVVIAAIDDEAEDTDDPADGVPNRDTPRDGATDDTLTYTLVGADAKHFKILGSMDAPVTDEDTAGQLMTRGSLNFEAKRRYVVTIKATDPSGDFASINVTINVEDVNDALKLNGPGAKDYMENGTGPVATYKGVDEDPGGVTYSLVEGIGDAARFTISSNDGSLRFKSSPNYEMPKDVAITGSSEASRTSDAVDNLYVVAVRARVAGATLPTTELADLDAVATGDTDDMAHKIVRVRVRNVNEPPKFAEDMVTQEIKENPDDPLQGPILNRGAGGSPALASLDVGIPVIAVDDDNEVDANNDFPTLTATEINEGHMVDGLTYALSGDDGPFHIIPATGQILTREKLDYEAKKKYVVTVKATDPMGLYDTTQVTIEVTDVDEVPVAGLLTLVGDAAHAYEENNPDTALGTYAVSGVTTTVTWALEGADAAHFKLVGDEASRERTLAFKSAPNYEMPRGQGISSTNTNTYMVAIKVTANDETETTEVTVTVSNIEERGMVSVTPAGGKVGVPITAELTDPDLIVGATEWQWHRVNPQSNVSVPIIGSEARTDTYTPVMADVDHFLRVTASYTDGEGPNKSASVTLDEPVQDANVAPAFAAETVNREVAENEAVGASVGAPITATDANGDAPVYSVSGTDAGTFTIDEDTGQLMTSAMLDYETKNEYMVTVTATDPEGATDSIAVTVTVTNVDEGGTVTLDPVHPRVGTTVMATVTDPDGGVTGPTWRWSHSTTMNGTFTPYSAETTASITPQASDVGRYLRVTATYTDALGANKTAMTTTAMPVSRNNVPAFTAATDTREVAENTAAGTAIGDPVTATDADNDTLAYSLGGADMASFRIDSATGQLSASAALNYEAKDTYGVTVTATDPYGASDMVTVTITVTDVDETGMVSLSSMAPMVGEELTASLTDPDGSVTGATWQWYKSMTMGGTFMAIAGATSMSYTPVEADTDYYLRVTVSYTDGQGSGKSAMATTTDKVISASVVARYAGADGVVDIGDMLDAIDDYFDNGLSIDDLLAVIDAYFANNG